VAVDGKRESQVVRSWPLHIPESRIAAPASLFRLDDGGQGAKLPNRNMARLVSTMPNLDGENMNQLTTETELDAPNPAPFDLAARIAQIVGDAKLVIIEQERALKEYGLMLLTSYPPRIAPSAWRCADGVKSLECLILLGENVTTVLLCAGNKRIADVLKTPTIQANNERISFIMTAPKNTDSPFLAQVLQLAPTVHALISSNHARLTTAITSHDATGGYGRGFTFHLKLELLIEQCLTCFETATSAPQFDCRWHRFETRYMQIADAEAPTLEKALGKLNVVSVREERKAA
jgi:hypothetical protein